MEITMSHAAYQLLAVQDILKKLLTEVADFTGLREETIKDYFEDVYGDNKYLNVLVENAAEITRLAGLANQLYVYAKINKEYNKIRDEVSEARDTLDYLDDYETITFNIE